MKQRQRRRGKTKKYKDSSTLGTAVYRKFPVTGPSSPQLCIDSLALQLPFLTLAQSLAAGSCPSAHRLPPVLHRLLCHRAPNPGLNRGLTAPYQICSEIFNAGSFECCKEQPCFPHISTLKSVPQACQTKQLLPGSPTPLLRWKSFNYVAYLQDLRVKRAAAISHTLTFL